MITSSNESSSRMLEGWRCASDGMLPVQRWKSAAASRLVHSGPSISASCSMTSKGMRAKAKVCKEHARSMQWQWMRGHAECMIPMDEDGEGQNHLQHNEQLVEVEAVLLHGATRRISVGLGGRLRPSDGCSLRSPSVVASRGTAKTECHSTLTARAHLGEQLRAKPLLVQVPHLLHLLDRHRRRPAGRPAPVAEAVRRVPVVPAAA